MAPTSAGSGGPRRSSVRLPRTASDTGLALGRVDAIRADRDLDRRQEIEVKMKVPGRRALPANVTVGEGSFARTRELPDVLAELVDLGR
jgi:hypothetical protein